MIRAMQAAVIVLILSAAALCGFLCWVLVATHRAELQLAADTHASLASEKALTDNANGLITDARPKIAASLGNLDAASANLKTVTANLKTASAGVDLAVKEITDPCHKGTCGMIATANRALDSVRMAAGQVTAVSEKEQDQRKLMNAQETQIASDTHEDLVKFGAAIDGITALSTNKDLTGTFTKLNGTMGSLDSMAAETATAWHKFLHPAWPKRIQGAVTTWGSAVAKFFVP